ncbi:MAG: ABC transporter permease [Alphaproteobacteria bacterium]|nr:ABC transporter permease [Alphaproteobacteria bacterium]
MLPNLVYLTLLLLVPFGIVALYSLYQHTATAGPVAVYTLANYAKLADPYFLRLIGRTAGIALKTTMICIVLAYPVAYFLARSSPGARVLGLFLLLTPLMVSAVVRAFGWLVILGRNGVVNGIVQSLGFERLDLMYSEFAVLLGLVHLLLPFMALPLVASIERIPPSVEEAARNLGAGSFLVFWRVVLPLSVPGLISGAMLVYVEAASAFVMPALLGGRHVRMIGNEVFDSLLVSFNLPAAATLTVTLVVFTIAVILLGTAAIRAAAGRR